MWDDDIIYYRLDMHFLQVSINDRNIVYSFYLYVNILNFCHNWQVYQI